MTDAGAKVAPPDPGHPVYFFPIVKGYQAGGTVAPNPPAAPPPNDVLRAIAVALHGQGYRLASKAHPPTLLLMFWWGYKAPMPKDVDRGVDMSDPMAQSGAGGNGDGLKELVLGSASQLDMDGNESSHTAFRGAERLAREWQAPRLFVMIFGSGLRKAAMQKDPSGHPNLVIDWTARASTELEGHTLMQVLPTPSGRRRPRVRPKHGRPEVDKNPAPGASRKPLAAHPAGSAVPCPKYPLIRFKFLGSA